LPASLPRPAEYFAEDVQIPDFDFSATEMDAWALEGWLSWFLNFSILTYDYTDSRRVSLQS
jgi:hypothetical protein